MSRKNWYESTNNAQYFKKYRSAKKAFFPCLIITIISLFSSFLCLLVWANNSGVLGEMGSPVDVSYIPFDVTKLPIVLVPVGVLFFIIMLALGGKKRKYGRLYRPLIHSRATKREYLDHGRTLKVIYDRRWNNTYEDMLDGIIQDALNDGFTILDDFKIKYNGKKAEVFELLFSSNLSDEELIEQCNRRNQYMKDKSIDMPEYYSDTPRYTQKNLEYDLTLLSGHGATSTSKTDTFEVTYNSSGQATSEKKIATTTERHVHEHKNYHWKIAYVDRNGNTLTTKNGKEFIYDTDLYINQTFTYSNTKRY